MTREQFSFFFASIRKNLKGNVYVIKKSEVGPQVSTTSGIRNIDIVDLLLE